LPDSAIEYRQISVTDPGAGASIADIDRAGLQDWKTDGQSQHVLTVEQWLRQTKTSKHSVAAVVAYEIADTISTSEIGIAVNKGNRAAIVDNFRSFVLENLSRARRSLHANRR
jgi:hypothetical protein